MSNNSTATTITNYTENLSTPHLSLVGIILWSTVFIILNITIIIGNTFVLYYYSSYRHVHRERPKGHLFLINLSVMDMLVGLVALPLYIYFLLIYLFKGHTPHHLIFYHLFAASDIISGFGSMLTIVLLSIDRCSAVVFPFRHRSIQRTSYMYGIIAAWTIATGIALTALLTFITKQNYFIFDYASGAVFALSIITVLTTNLLTILRAKSLKQHSQEELRRHAAYHKRLSRTFKLVIVAFFCTWLPFQCVSYSHLIVTPNVTIIPAFVSHSTKLLQYGGSFINCIIYYNNNREFKASIRRLFSLHRRSKRYKVSGQIHANHGLSLEITNNQSPS